MLFAVQQRCFFERHEGRFRWWHRWGMVHSTTRFRYNLIKFAFEAFAACAVSVNADIGEYFLGFVWAWYLMVRVGISGEPQPLLIKPGTSEFYNPTGRFGIISVNEGQSIELFCSGEFASPAGAGNSIMATCTTGNQFLYNNVRYNFIDFACKAFPAHTVRKTGARCYNNGYVLEAGFVVDSRFLKVYDSCFDEVREEVYYAAYKLTPENDGFQSGINQKNLIKTASSLIKPTAHRLSASQLHYWRVFRRKKCRWTLFPRHPASNHCWPYWIVCQSWRMDSSHQWLLYGWVLEFWKVEYLTFKNRSYLLPLWRRFVYHFKCISNKTQRTPGTMTSWA